MKNKKNIYILIPAVLIIWGVIGYRIVKSINPSQNMETMEMAVSTFKPTKIEASEPYSIKANYRDPFLGTLVSNKKVVKKSVQKNKWCFHLFNIQVL